MLYLYDKAIAADLRNDFVDETVVRVVETDLSIGLAAQLRNDQIQFPIVAITRNSGPKLDEDRSNFTRAHKGVAAVLDTETNELYYERALPIDLSYTITVLATNTADRDELIRELMFKYVSEYFLTIRLPYEADRKIRFGVEIDQGQEIEYSSGSLEYIESGQVYQARMLLNCRGCVMVNYTAAKLRRLEQSIDIENPSR